MGGSKRSAPLRVFGSPARAWAQADVAAALP